MTHLLPNRLFIYLFIGLFSGTVHIKKNICSVPELAQKVFFICSSWTDKKKPYLMHLMLISYPIKFQKIQILLSVIAFPCGMLLKRMENSSKTR